MIPDSLSQLIEIGATQVVASNLALQQMVVERDATIEAKDAEIAALRERLDREPIIVRIPDRVPHEPAVGE